MILNALERDTVKIHTGALQVAIDYLGALGNPHSDIVVTPAGQNARLSLMDSGVYAEYTLSLSQPLRHQFALPLHRLNGLLRWAEVGDRFSNARRLTRSPDRLEFRIAASAEFIRGLDSYLIPFSRLTDSFQPPAFNVISDMRWDRKLSDHLELAVAATRPGPSQVALDCVQIDQRSQRQSIAASNNSLMVAFCERTTRQMKEPSTFLVRRKHVPLLQRTCESKSSVLIEVGLQHARVQCGKRVAVFPRTQAHFPKWSEWFLSAKRYANKSLITEAECDLRKMAGTLGQLGTNNEIVELFLDEGRVQLSTETTGRQRRLRVRRRDLVSVVEHWPRGRARWIHQGPGRPIIVTPTDAPQNLIALLMPIVGQ